MANQTMKGVKQVKSLDPFVLQQASTVAATQDIRFLQGKEPGRMLATTIPDKTGILCVRGVKFNKTPSVLHVKACGKGTIEVRKNSPEGEILASIEVNHPNMQTFECKPSTKIKGTTDLYFVLKGKAIQFDEWRFK